MGGFSKRHPGLWQFIKFALVGCLTTGVELGVFALCNYLLFTGWRDTAVKWWLFDYGTGSGGLCALAALAVSFTVSQIFNFIVQRKVTFRSDSNKLVSGLIYAAMVIGLYILTLWLPTLFSEKLYAAVGAVWGGLITKLICMNVSFWVQFPMNKFVIMRRKKQA